MLRREDQVLQILQVWSRLTGTPLPSTRLQRTLKAIISKACLHALSPYQFPLVHLQRATPPPPVSVPMGVQSPTFTVENSKAAKSSRGPLLTTLVSPLSLKCLRRTHKMTMQTKWGDSESFGGSVQPSCKVLAPELQEVCNHAFLPLFIFTSFPPRGSPLVLSNFLRL